MATGEDVRFDGVAQVIALLALKLEVYWICFSRCPPFESRYGYHRIENFGRWQVRLIYAFGFRIGTLRVVVSLMSGVVNLFEVPYIADEFANGFLVWCFLLR